jgi:hypothetical protein
MNQWKLLHKTKSAAEANILKGVLEENAIQVQLLNKQDSSYLLFGEIEIYVPVMFIEVAKSILSKALLN